MLFGIFLLILMVYLAILLISCVYIELTADISRTSEYFSWLRQDIRNNGFRVYHLSCFLAFPVVVTGWILKYTGKAFVYIWNKRLL